ncbi:MAG: hypothetical protein LBP74_01210 [Treponema sp.]|nr:hypothetical protein [Treponema sp.]
MQSYRGNKQGGSLQGWTLPQPVDRRIKDCKAEAEALAEKREKPVIQVAKDLGSSDPVVQRWKQVFREAKGGGVQPFSGDGRPRDEELGRLRKENKALQRAKEILKKAAVHFAQGAPQ